VIVVGARVAGAATAMLLARRGLRVLAVDRASFPGDTVSSHQLQVPGVALMRRWGLLDALTAAGTPPVRRVRFDAGGGLVMDGQFPGYEGADALYSPRRTLLDPILVEAARQAGAEVRENFRVANASAAARGRSGCAPRPTSPNTFRCPHGPGWALAGDAGVMDSVSAQGMTNALRDASYLSAAVVAGLGGSRPLGGALRAHQRHRDRAIRGMYDFTLGLAAFRPATPGRRRFLAAVAADQRETDRFLGAFAGIVPPEQYFTLGTAVRVLGSRAIRQLMPWRACGVMRV
jgi:2-polyprenyl-6-methoxyphenol hydroxylase-like FAD-dependent oxidoreductase